MWPIKQSRRQAEKASQEAAQSIVESSALLPPLFDAAWIPGVRAPMCVGLGNPEMRTLITFDGETSGSKAQVVA